jgi:hypothetical protein
MAEAKSSTIETSTKYAPRRSDGGLNRSSSFKYYIHDSVSTCRLQLLGELNEQDVPELNGCWQTIKTTLGDRQLVLDLRLLDHTDGAGNLWLTNMAEEGASYLPVRSEASGLKSNNAAQGRKINPFTRVLGLLRNACTAGVD